MQIFYHRRYLKHFGKLNHFIKRLTERSIQIFQENHLDPRLHNHPLRGSMSGRRAISVTHDVRIIFEQNNDYAVVLFIDIGTHSQVY